MLDQENPQVAEEEGGGEDAASTISADTVPGTA